MGGGLTRSAGYTTMFLFNAAPNVTNGFWLILLNYFGRNKKNVSMPFSPARIAGEAAYFLK